MEALLLEPHALLAWVTRALLESAALVLLALALERAVLRGRAAALRAGLWACVFLRLVVPPLVRTDAAGNSFGAALGAPGQALVAAWAPDGGETLRLGLMIWGALALALLLRLARRARIARRELLGASWPAPPDVAHQARAIAAALGLRRVPRVRLHAGPAPALVLGWRRPVIALAEHLAGPAREAALWHECMHLRRRDPLAQAALEVLHALWWFHPLLPLAKRRAAAARELACDAAVVRAWSGGAERYRRVLLLEAARRLAGAPLLAPPALGWLRGPATLRLRLEALEPDACRVPLRSVRAAIGLLALGACVSGALIVPPLPTLPAWWGDVHAARAQVERLRERRPGEGCAPGRLILLRALALEQGGASHSDP